MAAASFPRFVPYCVSFEGTFITQLLVKQRVRNDLSQRSQLRGRDYFGAKRTDALTYGRRQGWHQRNAENRELLTRRSWRGVFFPEAAGGAREAVSGAEE